MHRSTYWYCKAVTDPNRWAIAAHRLAHRLWRFRLGFPALLVSRINRLVTGVDISPETIIGQHFSVGHGIGVVIGGGEIGDHCAIMQGVTIGLRNLEDAFEMAEAFPHLGHGVLVGANAVILGPIRIGDGAKIGAGAVVLEDVPPGWTAVGNPARLLPPKAGRENDVALRTTADAPGQKSTAATS